MIPIEELRRSPTAALFQGREEIGVSIFITNYPERGEGPDLHLHPYPEAFVVEEGAAVFTAGDEEIEVDAGHVVVVPAETPHGSRTPATARCGWSASTPTRRSSRPGSSRLPIAFGWVDGRLNLKEEDS